MLINYGDILDFDLVEETGNEIISSRPRADWAVQLLVPRLLVLLEQS